MGNQPQSLLRDDDVFDTPRPLNNDVDEGIGGTPLVSLPAMVLFVDSVLWPAAASSPAKQDSDGQKLWCTVFVDGRQLGPSILAGLGNSRMPLKVEQRGPNSQISFHFSLDGAWEEVKGHLDETKDMWEGLDVNEEREQEDNSEGKGQKLSNSSSATSNVRIEFPVAQLARYGAPLYTTLCLGLPLESETPVQLDLSEALKKAQAVDAAKVTITLFRPARERDSYGLPKPDFHAFLVEDTEPMPMCARPDSRPLGPTSAAQIKGLTRALQTMSLVASSLQGLSEPSLVRSLQEDPSATGDLAAEQLEQARSETERMRQELLECLKAKAEADERIESLTGALQQSSEQVRLLSMKNDQRAYVDLNKRYIELQAQYSDISAEHAMRGVEHEQARARAEAQIKTLTSDLRQSKEQLARAEELIKEQVALMSGQGDKFNELQGSSWTVQEALKEREAEIKELRQTVSETKGQLRQKAAQEADFKTWKAEQVEVLRGVSAAAEELQNKLQAKTQELEEVQEAHKDYLKASRSPSKRESELEQKLRFALQELEEMRSTRSMQKSNMEASSQDFSQMQAQLEQASLMIKQLQHESDELKQQAQIANRDFRRTQTHLDNVLAEQQALKAREPLFKELQQENAKLKEEMRTSRANNRESNQGIQQELEKGWSDLQSLRKAAQARNEEVRKARVDLEAWHQQRSRSMSPLPTWQDISKGSAPPKWNEISTN